MDIDPGSVVRCRPVLVTLGGHDYRVPARGAGDWLMAILEKGWADIVPGMLDAALDGKSLDQLYDEMTDGVVTAAECQAAAKEALDAVAGVRWWAAVKLIHAAARDPAAFGELRLSGVDLAAAPLGAVIAGLYRIYTRDQEPKQVAKFDAELMKLPPGVSAAELYDEQAAAASFEQMFTARRGR